MAKYAGRPQRAKKQDTKKGVNPFNELKNKRTHKSILNSRTPGADRNVQKSKSKQLETRKQMLDEYKEHHRMRRSKFDDNRIGENLNELTNDEKVTKRLVKIQKKKASKFDLDATDNAFGKAEGLTIGGRNVDDIDDNELRGEKKFEYEDEIASDVERELEKHLADRGLSNFGGGNLSKSSASKGDCDDSDDEEKERPKTAKEIYAEVMEKSKAFKAQRMKEAAQHEKQLLSLDDNFESLLPGLKMKTKSEQYNEAHQKADDYDQLMKELKADKRAKAAERMLTVEEQAEKRAQKLEKLEEERLARAVGQVGNTEEPMTESSSEEEDEDDEEEDEEEGEEGEEDDEEVGQDEEEVDEAAEVGAEDDSLEPDFQPQEEEEEDVEADEDDDQTEATGVEATIAGEESDAIQQPIENEDDDDESEGDGDMVVGDGEEPDFGEYQLECLVASDDENEEDEEQEEETVIVPEKVDASFDPMINEKGEEDLPFKISAPKDSDELGKFLQGRNLSTQKKVLNRIRTCAHPSVDKHSRKHLAMYLKSLFDRLLDSKVLYRQKELEVLLPELFEVSVHHAQVCWEFFSQKLEDLKKVESVPTFSNLRTVQLMLRVFPASDFRHPILSPVGLLLDVWADRLVTKMNPALLPVACLLLHCQGLLLGIGRDNVDKRINLAPDVDSTHKPDKAKFCSSFWKLLSSTLQTLCNDDVKSPKEGKWRGSVISQLASLCQQGLNCIGRAGYVIVETLLKPVVEKCTESCNEYCQKGFGLVKQRVENFEGKFELTSMQRREKPKQIPIMDPLFHDPSTSGPLDHINTKEDPRAALARRMKKKANDERRAAGKQLRRDAAYLQHLKTKDNQKREVAKQVERKRVAAILDDSQRVYHELCTENAGMDTSLSTYRPSKKLKKGRMGGNKQENAK